jgi:hypothetical protein
MWWTETANIARLLWSPVRLFCSLNFKTQQPNHCHRKTSFSVRSNTLLHDTTFHFSVTQPTHPSTKIGVNSTLSCRIQAAYFRHSFEKDWTDVTDTWSSALFPFRNGFRIVCRPIFSLRLASDSLNSGSVVRCCPFWNFSEDLCSSAV